MADRGEDPAPQEPAPQEPAPQDFSYDVKAFARLCPDNELPSSFAPLHHSFAFESHKRSNLHYLDEVSDFPHQQAAPFGKTTADSTARPWAPQDATLIFCAGGIVHFYDLHTKSTSYLPSIGGNEIGCIEVHQARKLICVAEKGEMPNAFIYEYPSLTMIRVLKGGTERSYSAANFNGDGTMLATVGSFPDYMLTVWDWHKEAIVLRAKAFSQDVYRVSFSPRFAGQLVTSGTGHIRFWKMAETFTGLKLQGDIGKFGQVELTDIEGYCEMPDGKVLSGADSGNLLLWEGNLIKCEIRRAGGKGCHNGAIRVVLLHGNQIITGGNDGYVRTWPLKAIESAEPTDDMPIFEISPQKEVCFLGHEKGRTMSHIQTMLKGEGHWLVQDACGAVYKLVIETASVEHLFSFHSGRITGLDLCPFNHAAATCGSDGTVRLWDYAAKAPISVFRSPAPATVLVWAPRSVDPEGRTICAGYKDGVVRVLTRCKDGLHLKQAFKPHTVPIVSVAYSPDGRHLASGAQDGAVFFIAITRTGYTPVGFMNPPNGANTAVTSLAWASEDALFVGYADGRVAELTLPAEPDTSETYALPFEGKLLDTMPIVEYRRAVAKAKKAKEAPAPAPAADGEEAEDVPVVEEVIPDFDAGGIAAILPLKNVGGRSLYVAFANEAGTYWRVTWGDAKVTPQSRHATPLVFLNTSRSSQYLLSCATDGSVCAGEAASNAYWQGRVHGASRKTMLGLSFDDAFIVSAGADGNLFVHKMSASDQKDAILSAASLPAVADAGLSGLDITEASTYSIEEAKQKAEADARAAAAEEAKLSVREKVALLRKKFTALLSDNEALPVTEQLPRDAFYVDPGLQDGTEKETLERLKAAEFEFAWTSEKAALVRTKLENHFLKGLAVESITLYGFANGLCVRSFRSLELEQWQKEAIEHVHALIDKEAKKGQATRKKSTSGEGFKEGEEDAADAKEGEGAAKTSSEPEKKISKVQERLLRRQARAKEWAEFNATKPDDKYEDPVDVAAIQYAETHMGDFSLKTDEDYVVPESQRVNAQKKRRQIVLLDESIHAIKMGYNERFLALRDLKSRLIASMVTEDARLAEINRELETMGDLLPPDLVSPGALVADEQPELRATVTPETLTSFRMEKAAAAAAAKGGMGGGGAAPAKPSASAASTATGAASSKASSLAAASTALEVTEARLTRERLVVEKARLVERRRRTIASFDDAVAELRTEKLKLEADLKTTDLRKLVLFQELVLLKEFEKKDTSLAKRLESKHNEKSEIVAKVAECQEKLTQKKMEIERLLDRDRQIMAEFHSALGENNKFSEVLLKIFKKKIKRKRQSANDDDDEEDEDEDEDEDDDDGEGEDEEEGEETCPPGCDPSLYDKVCDLREKRLEQEEIYADFQKGVDMLKKENDMLIKKEKAIDKALKDTETDIQAFQTEKQGELNELHVVVTLHMSQVRHIEDGQLPVDLTKDLVFPSSELEQLRNRIKELGQEKADLRKRQKSLRVEHVSLVKAQGVKAQRLRELDARAVDVQMLKFGQIIDLERIESVGVNKIAEELNEKIKKVEAAQELALTQIHDKLKQAKNDLKVATEESTQSLNTVAALFERQHALETSLNSKQAQVAPKDAGKERKERTSLVQLVKIQAKEIEALKLEINMLRRKGGHVYTGGK